MFTYSSRRNQIVFSRSHSPSDPAGRLVCFFPLISIPLSLTAACSSSTDKVKPELQSILSRLHVLIIGPGLGREPYMQTFANVALSLARQKGMFIVLDADALYLVGQEPSIIQGYRRAVVTPNIVEFRRLSEQVGVDPNTPIDKRAEAVSRKLGGVTVLQKGPKDIIAADSTGEMASSEASQLGDTDQKFEKVKEVVEVDLPGGLKRCGGQGDLLSGAVGTFLAWGKCYEDGAFGYVTFAVDPSFALLIPSLQRSKHSNHSHSIAGSRRW
jgi:ATP-dependent NAD(P)H-hydrate dehydratase